MKEFLRKVSVVIVVLSLTSCGFGYSIDEKFTPLNPSQTPIACATLPENVELFFEGEKYNFEYEKQGMIEVQGDRYAKDAELIEKLKKLAKSKCCDAVINLKKNYIDRESGFIFSNEPTEKYSAISYFGIAVKKKN
ncbi:MAG: hypothetical protein K2P85_10805 [Flavobacteriaceae bacterium]|nr:hypothetical protein [Flavobacteriaceae bacterium]